MDYFDRCRLLCLPLLRQPNKKCAEDMKKFIFECPQSTLKPMFHLIFVPLKTVLEREEFDSKTDLHIVVMDSLSGLMEKCLTDAPPEVVIAVLEMLSTFLMRKEKCAECEEWEVAFMSLIRKIVERLTPIQSDAVFRRQNLLLLSHLIFHLIQQLNANTVTVSLKVADLQCLRSIISIKDSWPPDLIAQKGDTLSASVPGLSTALFRILIADDVKINRALKEEALVCLEALLRAIFSDHFLALSEATWRSRGDSEDRVAGLPAEAKLPDSRRSAAWVAEAAQRLRALCSGEAPALRLLLQRLPPDAWRVRLAAVRLCDRTLHRCAKSLAPLRPALLECLLCLSEDDYPEVSKPASAALTSFRAELQPLCLQNITELSGSLVALLHSVQDREKLPALRSLSANLRVLLNGDVRFVLLEDCSLMRKIVAVVLRFLEMDVSEIALMEEVRFADALERHSSGCEGLFRKNFVHFRDPGIFAPLASSCGLFGQFGDFRTLLSILEGLVTENPSNRPAALLIGRLALQGSLQDENSTEERIANIRPFLINFLLDRDILERPLSIWESEVPLEDPDVTETRPRDVKENVLNVCLTLEGLAIAAKFFPKDKDPLFLLEALFPVLALLAGRSPAVVVHTAQLSLRAISAAAGFANISDLLLANADYLLDALSRQLRKSERYPDSPRVLMAILEQGSDQRLLPLLVDVMEEMLLELDDVYEERSCLFLPVFVSLLSALRRWFAPKSLPSTAAAKTLPLRRPIFEEVKEYLLEQRYRRERARAEFKEPEAGQEEEMRDLWKEEEEEEKAASHHKLTEAVMTRCAYLLSSESPQLRFLCLRALREGCFVLSDCESILLPLVHLLWPCLLARFSDANPNVVMSAFELLTALADVSGDFIRARITADVMERMTCFLRQQFVCSYKVKSPVYKFSTAFKIQRQLLQEVGALCAAINLQSAPLEKLLTSVLPYLSCFQPAGLREACFGSVQRLYLHDPGLVWFKLHELNPTIVSHRKIENQSVKTEFDAALLNLLEWHPDMKVL